MRRLLYLVALAMALDVATTAYSLAHGRTEGNPLMAPLLAVGGIPAFVWAKATAFAVIALIATTWPSRAMRLAVGLAIAVTVYFAVLNLGGS